MEINELIENFELLEDWEDKYRYLIDLGGGLEPLDEKFKTEEFKVKGCQSQVWLVPELKDGILSFKGDSDAIIVRGLIAVVLTVFKEANDAVVSYRSVRQTAALKVNLRDAARKYVELAQLQYRGGSINYIDVLDAQRRYFDAQIGVSNAVRDEHLALVDLYKALGGGWAE